MNNSRYMTLLLLSFCVGCGGAPKAELETTETPAAQPAQGKVSQAQPPVPVVKRITLAERKVLLSDGRAAVAGGDLSTAEELLKKVILEATGEPGEAKVVAEARYNLGVLAEWQGESETAKRHYEAALSVEPELGIAVVAVGRLLLRDGDGATALNYARGRLVGRTKSIPLRNALNRLRLASDTEVAKIVPDSKALLREDEKNVEAMVNLAAAYHRDGKYELAIAILENAKALDGQHPEIFWRMGEAQLKLNEKIRARMTFEEATQLPYGATAEVYNNLGLIYHEAGDFSGAELQFRKALARWPEMISAQINLGNSLRGQQRYQDALETFQAALARAPENALISYNLGILLLDGQFAGLKPLERLERSIGYFDDYKRNRKTASEKDPVDSYIAEAKKRVVVEEKRAAQMRRAPKPAPEPTPEPAEGDGSSTSPTPENGEPNPVDASSTGSDLESGTTETTEEQP